MMNLHQLQMLEFALVDAAYGQDHHPQLTHSSEASTVYSKCRLLSSAPSSVEFVHRDHLHFKLTSRWFGQYMSHKSHLTCLRLLVRHVSG